MPAHPQIIQFVCFETSLPSRVFLSRWQPFAAMFLAMGIERVVLGESDGAGGFGFVSRNVWPEPRFRAAFRGKVPGDAGGGPVIAVQAGGFHVAASAGMQLFEARVGVVKTQALVRCRKDALGTIVATLGHLQRSTIRASAGRRTPRTRPRWADVSTPASKSTATSQRLTAFGAPSPRACFRPHRSRRAGSRSCGRCWRCPRPINARSA